MIRDVTRTLAVVRDATISETRKEKLVQAATLDLFMHLALVASLTSAIFLCASMPLLIAHFLGYSSFTRMIEWFTGIEIILISTIVSATGICLLKRNAAL